MAFVGERRLAHPPNALVRIEFGRIRRERNQAKPAVLSQELANGLAFVRRAAVPEQDNVALQVTQQVAREVDDLGLLDVLAVNLIVEPDAAPYRAEGNGRDHG